MRQPFGDHQPASKAFCLAIAARNSVLHFFCVQAQHLYDTARFARTCARNFALKICNGPSVGDPKSRYIGSLFNCSAQVLPVSLLSCESMLRVLHSSAPLPNMKFLMQHLGSTSNRMQCLLVLTAPLYCQISARILEVGEFCFVDRQLLDPRLSPFPQVPVQCRHIATNPGSLHPPGVDTTADQTLIGPLCTIY